MRYAASEKLEIIRTVEDSSLGITRTLAQVGIPKSTFYHWYDRYLTGGVETLADRKPAPTTICNNNLLVPMEVLNQVILHAVSEALDEGILEKAVNLALQRLQSGGHERVDRTSQIKRELDLIEAKTEKLLDAIAITHGDSPAPLVERVQRENQRGNELKAELAKLQSKDHTVLKLDEAR